MVSKIVKGWQNKTECKKMARKVLKVGGIIKQWKSGWIVKVLWGKVKEIQGKGNNAMIWIWSDLLAPKGLVQQCDCSAARWKVGWHSRMRSDQPLTIPESTVMVPNENERYEQPSMGHPFCVPQCSPRWRRRAVECSHQRPPVHPSPPGLSCVQLMGGWGKSRLLLWQTKRRLFSCRFWWWLLMDWVWKVCPNTTRSYGQSGSTCWPAPEHWRSCHHQSGKTTCKSKESRVLIISKQNGFSRD